MNRHPPRTSLRSGPAPGRLDAHVGYWLRRVSNQFSLSLTRALEDKGVSLVEWLALRELYDRDLTPSELAERLGMTRGAVSKLAGKLANSLMIVEQATAGGLGRRTQVLSLTDGGRAVVRVFAGFLDDADEEFFGHLEPETRALVLAIMRDIVHRRGLRTAPMDG